MNVARTLLRAAAPLARGAVAPQTARFVPRVVVQHQIPVVSVFIVKDDFVFLSVH
jgi:hypothetical protein